MIELAHEFTFDAQLAPARDFGPGPYGQRMYFRALEGTVSGHRIQGRFLGGGGDWLLLGADGFGRLDVRGTIETEGGALIYITYGGVLEFNQAVQNAVATGAGTDWSEQYFRVTPRLETGTESLEWVNQSVFVARGRLLPELVVEYEVYRVT